LLETFTNLAYAESGATQAGQCVTFSVRLCAVTPEPTEDLKKCAKRRS
jgi:hypothetical protein